MIIRKALEKDLSRIGEIYVFNNRVNYLPIFKDYQFSFGELQVVNVIENYFKSKEVLENIFVYDDGIIKGFVEINKKEILKLYVDTFFQGQRIGKELIEFAIENYDSTYLWALEKNERAIKFYEGNGFKLTRDKKFEEDTTEYLLKLSR